MPGFSRLETRLLLVAILIVFGTRSANAEVWQLSSGPNICPIQRLDTGSQTPAADQMPRSVPVAATPPATEIVPPLNVDPPTRAGFAGPDLFVCCSQGAADHERCEVIDLRNGQITTVALDAEAAPPNWLKRLEERAVWFFPGLEIAWSEEVKDESTVFKATLRHRASGATVELGTVAIPVVGALRLWGVRAAPDGSRFALIRHAYFGEYTDVYPVTIYAASDAPRAVYLNAAKILTGGDSEEAARMARALSSAPSKKND